MSSLLRATRSREADEVRLNTLVLIRWLAIAGQATTLLVVQMAFALEGWIHLPMAAVAVSVAFNLFLTLRYPQGQRIGSATAAGHLVFDLLQLAALMYLTGGLHNPFALFFIAPVTVAAATLSWRRTVLLTVLTVVAASVLAVWHLPLPWPGMPIRLPTLYVTGFWTALVLTAAFAAFYTWRMAEEARLRAAALSATQIALAHEQRLGAVGALAAAVAHEMSTPLGTISLVAKELARDLPPEGPLAEDIGLIVSQSERCRSILTQLGEQRDAERDAAIDRLPLGTLVELTAEPHRRNHESKEVVFDGRPESGSEHLPAPWAAQRPEILHGLGNFIQNAIQFARRRIAIETRWTAEYASVRIVDDGPGFHQHILAKLGEPYLSSRAGDGIHMGLGVFIATTLLARTNAKVTFTNHAEGGAVVTVIWPRAAFGDGPGQAEAGAALEFAPLPRL